MQEEYTKESFDYLKNTDIEKRKKLGQYFTPKTIRDLLLKELVSISEKKDNVKILDPACGRESFFYLVMNILKVLYYTDLILMRV